MVINNQKKVSGCVFAFLAVPPKPLMCNCTFDLAGAMAKISQYPEDVFEPLSGFTRGVQDAFSVIKADFHSLTISTKVPKNTKKLTKTARKTPKTTKSAGFHTQTTMKQVKVSYTQHGTVVELFALAKRGSHKSHQKESPLCTKR